MKHTNIWIVGISEEEEKKKGYEKNFEEIIVENFPNMEKGNSQSSPRDADSPIQDKVKVKVAQSCPTFCDPMDYTVHGLLQARILEWAAYPFSRGSS